MRTRFPVLTALLLVTTWLAGAAGSSDATASKAQAAGPQLGQSAPSFALADVDARVRALRDFRRPTALFFFCGCPWCRDCAEVWGRFQHGGALASASGAAPPATVVVFSGGAGEARAFAAQTGLDPSQTTLLVDPDLRVTQGLYRAAPCPRAFVLDAAGRVRYTNDHKDDAPRAAPALAIASRILTALRASEATPAPEPKPTLTSAALSATTLDGRAVDIAAKSGWKVVYFWSGACPCVRACERYSFAPLADKYRGRVAFYAVASCGWDLSQTRPQLARQIQQRRLPYPVLLDTTHRVAQALGARVTPQTFVLDPQGRVVFAGMPDDSRRFLLTPGARGSRVAHTYLSVALAQALAGKPVTNSPLPEAGCMIAW